MQRLHDLLGTEYLGAVHVPSFLLGCFITISLALMEPLLRALVGGLIVTAVQLIKYSVMVCGIVLCGVIVLSKDKKRSAMEGSTPVKLEDTQIPTPRDQFIEDASNDFDIVGYNSMTSSKHRKHTEPITPARTEENAYENFIQMAGCN